jgi:EAL domain-containing protein (putative c-di-GMP-specific phosphodiesterase class I)
MNTLKRFLGDLNFLTGTGDPERGRIIVSYMIRMVRSLGMELIAEGVETAEQATFLKERNCTELQGYYFHKPMPVNDLEKLFDKTE